MRRTRAVPHQNTVFRQLTNHLPWGALERIIAQHRADAGVRRLSTKNLLLTLLFAQVSDARSLRDIEAILESHAARRYHAGLRQVHRSTLADAAATRPAAVFTELLSTLLARASRKLRQGVNECVRLIDSTTVPLSSLSADWSRFSAQLCGAKAHVVLDPDADCPVYLGFTPARVNDITAAKDMPIDQGATYVFDLGYYDFGWWAKLDDAGCRIVTRLKCNTKLEVIETLPVPDGADNIASDRISFLPERMAKNRHNPMPNAVREINVTTENGSVLRLMTNDLDASASEIAALYKRRWAIELFFRWIKQTLKMRHFYGTSENAVRIQIAVALIAFVLIKLAHAAQGVIESLTQFARLIQANVMHRRPLNQLRSPARMPNTGPLHCRAQTTLLWA
jgi:IS4 transposase